LLTASPSTVAVAGSTDFTATPGAASAGAAVSPSRRGRVVGDDRNPLGQSPFRGFDERGVVDQRDGDPRGAGVDRLVEGGDHLRDGAVL
jgi:hypothetical protein